MMPPHYPEKWGPLVRYLKDLVDATSNYQEFRSGEGRQLDLGEPWAVRQPHRLTICWSYDDIASNPLVARGFLMKVYDASRLMHDNLKLCGVNVYEIRYRWNGIGENKELPEIAIELLVPEIAELKGMPFGDWRAVTDIVLMLDR